MDMYNNSANFAPVIQKIDCATDEEESYGFQHAHIEGKSSLCKNKEHNAETTTEIGNESCKVVGSTPQISSQGKHFVIDTLGASSEPSNASPRSPTISRVHVVKTERVRSNTTSRAATLPKIVEVPASQENSTETQCAPPNIQFQPPLNQSQRYSVPDTGTRPATKLSNNCIRVSKSIDLANLTQWRNAGKTPGITIRNHLDKHDMMDHLHSKLVKDGYKNTSCCKDYCKGSHLQLRPKQPCGAHTSSELIEAQAEDFIRQYYESKRPELGQNTETELEERLDQVRSAIHAKGHYRLTTKELQFGVRTAWRNSPRCISRVVWKQLEVLDARHVNTPKEMFEALCRHMRYANNNGKLKAVISVFPKRTKKNSDFRVWNSQLIRYAGYKNSDGSILGDPANVELTQIILEHFNWSPPGERTEFDLLPLLLQANGGDPELFEMPSDLIPEVHLSHPEYAIHGGLVEVEEHDWFQDLGLRWYAIPAVSSMLLEIGGMKFPAAPFSGWYMCTEVARDLGDTNRYNKLPLIARGLGMDPLTHKLWKDRAMVELNVAILHSFHKASVTIVDHHSATESFVTHMKLETKLRGGCPADWVWMVPPISGSLTPVYHQEMLLYHMSPSYEYQHDPWTYHIWSAKHRRCLSQKSLPKTAVAEEKDLETVSPL